MVESGLKTEKALGAALALAGIVVAVAIIAAGVLIGRARPAGPLELATSETTSTALTSAGEDDLGLPPGARELAISRIPSESASPTETAASSSAETRTASAAGAQGGTVSGGGDGRAAPNGGSPGSGGTAPDEGTPGGSTGSAPTSSVRGTVRHAVWGTPVPRVRITLSPLGASAQSGASGAFAFDDVPDGRLLLVSVADLDSWRSRGGLMAAFYSPRAASVDFEVYPVSEAYGTEWRDAAWWRSASSGELASAAGKVGLASSAFRGLTGSGAVQILAVARTGTPQQRARGELLATWLDLASGRLGFDTRVSALNISGASAFLPAHAGALEYARAADSVINGRVDWNVLRRALSERALDTRAGAGAESFTAPAIATGREHGKMPGRR